MLFKVLKPELNDLHQKLQVMIPCLSMALELQAPLKMLRQPGGCEAMDKLKRRQKVPLALQCFAKFYLHPASLPTDNLR